MPTILKLVSKSAIDLAKTETRRYRLEQVNEAYTTLDRGEIVGRAVVIP